jgi:hypothetical protein
MKTRDPLTERIKHELREIDPDPWGWIEGPHTDERPLWERRPWNRWDGLAALLLCLASAATAIWVIWVVCRWLLSLTR